MIRLALPEGVKRWSLTGIETRLIKTGGRLAHPARKVATLACWGAGDQGNAEKYAGTVRLASAGAEIAQLERDSFTESSVAIRPLRGRRKGRGFCDQI